MQLESMYVELVPKIDNFCFLKQILQQCHQMRNLHIHSIRKAVACTQVADMRTYFASLLPNLDTVKFTCEQAFAPKTKAVKWPSHLKTHPVKAEYIMLGNISYQLKPVPSSNLVIFEDGLQSDQLRGVEQAIVAMEAIDRIKLRRLSKVVSRPDCWTDVSCLCLVLRAPRGSNLPGTVGASSYLIDATQLFFKSCVRNITELNMASFHFDHGSDGSAIVGCTLPHLQALALTPCGVNQVDALAFLARGCRNLTLLEVRAEHDSNGACLCEFCKTPLRFSEAGFKELHRTTKLGRLSLDNAAKMTSLDFLRECRVTDLRFSLHSLEQEVTNTAGFHASLTQLLRANTKLSFLAIETRGMQLQHNAFAEGLANISTLRHLCVLTDAVTTADHVTSFFR
ncbi:hypothetical protein V5799_018353 [Amblyomma americanum]|uniref:Uncharacterized protein n=1 Tax=Amblyomma americanum TaxID=6943 RepID=A0AAQ4EZQ7_AMBAM